MKIETLNSFHLTYCTNIHLGEEWSRVFANLRQYIPELKAHLAPDKPFGIGLRLADVATRELLQSNALADFHSWLTEQDLYVFTLNGFPYGGFHCQVVKDQVYATDWSKQERLDYTLRLVNILAKLLPAEMEGSISTLPYTVSFSFFFSNPYLAVMSVKLSFGDSLTTSFRLPKCGIWRDRSIHPLPAPTCFGGTTCTPR